MLRRFGVVLFLVFCSSAIWLNQLSLRSQTPPTSSPPTTPEKVPAATTTPAAVKPAPARAITPSTPPTKPAPQLDRKKWPRPFAPGLSLDTERHAKAPIHHKMARLVPKHTRKLRLKKK